MRTATMTTPAPAARELQDDWETMLAGLASDRVRRLLEDAVGTLEPIVRPTDAALDTVLRQLRRALAQLGVRS
jgi:hypothetical protein